MKKHLTLACSTLALCASLTPLAGCSDGESPDGTGGEGDKGATGGIDGGRTGGATGTGGTPATGGVGATGGTGTGGTGTGGTGTGGTGTGGEENTAKATDPTFAGFQKLVTLGTCDSTDCHGGNEFNPLSLVLNDGLYDLVMNHTTENCDGMPFIVPGEPEQSALIKILRDGCMTTITKEDENGNEVTEDRLLRMPSGCVRNEMEDTCMPDKYLDPLIQWVADGALRE